MRILASERRLNINSDKTWVFDQSERAQGPIYVIIKCKKYLESSKLEKNRASWSKKSACQNSVALAISLGKFSFQNSEITGIKIIENKFSLAQQTFIFFLSVFWHTGNISL